MQRLLGSVAVAAALLAGAAGCAAPPAPMALAARRLAVARAQIPAGFTDAKQGLAYRWSDRACTAAGHRCRMIDLYAYDTCARGYLEGVLRTASGREVGVVNGQVAIARAGGRDRITVRWTTRSAVAVKITDLECD